MNNETRQVGEIKVRATRILGTSAVVLSAWVPGKLCGEHHTVTTFGDDWYGRVGTERLPAELDALRGEERSRAVRAWQERKYLAAYKLIGEAFPELDARIAAGRWAMGEVEIEIGGAS